MSYLWKLVIIPALLALVKSDFPVNYEESIYRSDVDPTVYRLPENLDPIHYNIEITPYFESEEGKEAFTFDGVVTITIKALRDDITNLIIQENVREIVSVTLTDESGVPIPLNNSNPFERIREYHFLRVNLRDGLTLSNQQNYLLTVEYIGNINETPLSRGIFRGSYKDDDGRVHWYAASHLQPTNSRQAFPSFDEPGFKSTFSIIINRPTRFTESFSNMKIAQLIPNGNRTKEIFFPTPRMSAYLVTIHISEEFTVIADNNDASRSYRILARPNSQGQGEYALEVGPPLTSWLEDYFGIPYYTMGEDMKNDQIAVPDWASGATENWGLVSYRELRLLYEEGETNIVDKLSIGTITAHELAHKWFGNLITCRWWDNVWINEGFASYFEYFAMDAAMAIMIGKNRTTLKNRLELSKTHIDQLRSIVFTLNNRPAGTIVHYDTRAVDRSLELEDQFNIMYVQSALSADSSASTRALQHTVNSPTEVTGHFSGISYSKGASLLLMLKYLCTETTFKKALNYFLVDRAFEHAFPEDLYRNFAIAVEEDANAVDASVNIYDFFKYWVDEPGYPVITVNIDMSTGLMSLTQERFFISPTASQTDQVWPVPLTYTTGNNPNWNNLRPTHVMTTKSLQIQKEAVHEWVIFNVQQKGIYRVNYDTHNWEMIASALKQNPNSIHYLNRAQIVDDVFALMRSERMTYSLGFQVLDFLKDDTNYYVWYPALTGFSWLRNRFLHLPDTLAKFDEIIFSFIDKVITELGYDIQANEPISTTLNRFYLMNFACNIGHEGCINDAVAKFSAFRNGVSVSPNIRRHVFCKGLHEGGYDDWRFLYQRRLDSNNQASGVAILRALGCTTNAQALNELMTSILSDDVKAQDRVNAFTFIYMGDRRNANVALQFIKQRVDDIRKAVVLPAWFNNILSNLASYLDEEGLKDMEEWLLANQTTIPEYQVGISAIASARSNMQWGTDRADMILEAARGSAMVVFPTVLLICTSLMALVLS